MLIHSEILMGIEILIFVVIMIMFVRGLYHLIVGRYQTRNKQLLSAKESRQVGLALASGVPIFVIEYVILGLLVEVVGILEFKSYHFAVTIAGAISIVVSFVWMGIIFSRIPGDKKN